jgi:8-oxo-dGTP pyrophosphatase MutT (NUDIX family)
VAGTEENMTTGNTSWSRERAEGEAVPEAVPAATTVLVRDGDDGVEVLMARRNSRLSFAGGAWVFPGGKVDPGDWDGEPVTDLRDPRMIDAARRAAVREAAEETGAIVDGESLVLISHWTPPVQAPKRFATYFFLGPVPAEIADLQADGGEIHELGWLRPAAALESRNAGEIELAPPQFITLEHLRPFTTAAEALAHYAARRPEHFATSFAGVEGGMIAMYEGDVAYGTDDVDVPGPRHRLWMVADGWRYERTNEP